MYKMQCVPLVLVTVCALLLLGTSTEARRVPMQVNESQLKTLKEAMGASLQNVRQRLFADRAPQDAPSPDEYGHVKNCGDPAANVSVTWYPRDLLQNTKRVNLSGSISITRAWHAGKIHVAVYIPGIKPPAFRYSQSMDCTSIGKQLRSKCPFKPGVPITGDYYANVDMGRTLPPGSYVVKASLDDLLGQEVVCLEADVKVVSKVNSPRRRGSIAQL